MKLMFYFMLPFILLTFALAQDQVFDWKVISQIPLTKEEKSTTINQYLNEIRMSDASEEDIKDEEIEWQKIDDDDTNVFWKLNEEDVYKNFPQLKNVPLVSNCSSGWTTKTFVYDPQIINKNSVNSQVLECKHDFGVPYDVDLLCRYESKLAYYSHYPTRYFTIEGQLKPAKAIEIERAWINRDFVPSDFDFNRLPTILNSIAYENGKYLIGYYECGCWGTYEVILIDTDDKLQLKLISEPVVMCS